MDKTAIKDASTIIVLRDAASSPSVLMGQRGKSAAFMPGKFVFPGGAVDPNDATVPVTPLTDLDEARLADESDVAPAALAAAGHRGDRAAPGRGDQHPGRGGLRHATGSGAGASQDRDAPVPVEKACARRCKPPALFARGFFFLALPPLGPHSKTRF